MSIGNLKDPSERKIKISERIHPRTMAFLKKQQGKLKWQKRKSNLSTAIEACIDYCIWAHDEHKVDVLNFK